MSAMRKPCLQPDLGCEAFRQTHGTCTRSKFVRDIWLALTQSVERVVEAENLTPPPTLPKTHTLTATPAIFICTIYITIGRYGTEELPTDQARRGVGPVRGGIQAAEAFI